MNTTIQNDNSCFKVLHSCFCLKSLISQQVHPLNPSGSKHSEFLFIDNKRTLRIIHIKPENQNIPRMSYDYDKRLSISRHSLTEEYWFTRWNKPLRAGSCTCSFRRSQRYSKLSDQFHMQIKKSHYTSSVRLSDLNNIKEDSCGVPATKITNIETFVERLVQDTYFEALQEYLMQSENNLINSSNGFDNLGYNVDDLDGVVLRRKPQLYLNAEPAVLSADCTTVDMNYSNIVEKTGLSQSLTVQSNNKDITLEQSKNICSHNGNSVKSKPLIMLLHGIGSTADVWWNIINNLHLRGYEIIAPDMLGHGYSSAPDIMGAYKFKNLLRNALQVFDYYVTSDERKAIIIGHSFGCSLGTALARYRMPKIVQLILISGGGPTPLAAPVNRNEFSCNCATLLKPLLFCGLRRSFFYSSRGKHFQPCETDSGIPSYVLKYIEKGQNWPEGDAAFHRRILIPTLLVHGLQDTNVTLVQECEMERTIPRAFLELIPNAGHMPMLETPEHLSHMITCFMDWWIR